MTQTEMQIQKLFFLKMNSVQISEKMNIKLSTVRAFIKNNNLITERNKHYEQVIRKGLNENKDIKDVAAELNMSPKEVSHLAGQLKITTNFKKIRIENYKKLIIEEYKKNPCGIRQMSIRLKINYPIVKETYEQYGLKNIIQRIPRYNKLDQKKYNDIIRQLSETDHTMTQIAQQYGVSKQWIQYIKKKNNIKRKKKK